MTFPAEKMSRVMVSSCNVCFALSEKHGGVLRCGLPFNSVPDEEVTTSCKDCTPPPALCRLREGPVLLELDVGATRSQVARALTDDEQLVEYMTNHAAQFLGCSHETAERLLKELADKANRAPRRTS